MAPKVNRIWLLFTLLFFLCGVMTYSKDFLSVTNHFETEVVNITLAEYENKGKGEVQWEDFPTILPNEKISKIPRIYNEGCDCYVRAKVKFRGIEEIGEEQFFGIETSWIKADDGCYYYTEILPHGKSVDLFQGLNIPESLSKENQGKTFWLDVSVDAIQSKNFSPQFENAAPWGSVEIISSKQQGEYEINKIRPSKTQNFQIKFEGAGEKLFANTEDFFSNFPGLMPGDCYTDSILMKNTGNDPVKLYFRSDSNKDCELSKKIRLKITVNSEDKSEVLYEGVLNGSDMGEDFLLGIFDAREEAAFEFEILVPSELNNEYSLYSSQVTWIFSTEPIPNNNPGMVHTGDQTNFGIYLLTAVASSAVYGWILWKKRKEQN